VTLTVQVGTSRVIKLARILVRTTASTTLAIPRGTDAGGLLCAQEE
jgi:hypothetical protein